MRALLLKPWLRGLSLALAVTFIVNLFYHGAQPYAVGLFAPPWDKLVHALSFGGLALLLMIGFGLTHNLLALAVSLVVAALDETVQIFEPGRSASLLDLSADALGIAGAMILFGWTLKRQAN